MIKIIAKGYKYLLTQIDDFLESARTIVISLKSVKGRKEYEQLFDRKLDDQKTNIKIRIISLKQSRLTDFISNLFEKSISRYSIFDQMLSEYSNLKILLIEKINKNKRHCKVRNVISIFQKVLSDFFGEGFIYLKRKSNYSDSLSKATIFPRFDEKLHINLILFCFFIMLTREEIFVIYEAGPEAVISVIQRLENIIEEEQAVRIAELEKRVKIVEARLNQNSQNSSKPPSTDVFCSEKPKPKSSRTISGKKAGGQKGHPGKTLEMVENPD